MIQEGGWGPEGVGDPGGEGISEEVWVQEGAQRDRERVGGQGGGLV